MGRVMEKKGCSTADHALLMCHLVPVFGRQWWLHILQKKIIKQSKQTNIMIKQLLNSVCKILLFCQSLVNHAFAIGTGI